MTSSTSTIEIVFYSDFPIMALPEYMIIARKRKRMSQSDLAKKIGVSRNYISQIECGDFENVSLRIINKICKEFGFRIKINGTQ